MPDIALEVGLLASGAFRITPVDQQHVDLIRQRGVVHRSRNPAVAKLLWSMVGERGSVQPWMMIIRRSVISSTA